MSLITRCHFCSVELCAYCKGVANKERCECKHKATCSLYVNPNELDDARLIAAAPDMYAACSIMRNQHEAIRGHCDCVICNAARKAEGK